MFNFVDINSIYEGFKLSVRKGNIVETIFTAFKL